MTEVKLMRDNLQESTLQLDEIEPISGVTFGTLACDSQHIIIGSVQTRDRTDFRKKYVHHYYGPNLIRILFSTFQLPNEQILRSRYHHEFPITAKDPLTNEVIVGEVSFYLMELGAAEATFFGSDFNYASSKLFRDKFKEYTPDNALIDLGYRE